MFYHPAAFVLGIRDVIAAWLVCLTLIGALFAFAAVETIDEASGAPAAGINAADGPRTCSGPA